MSERLGGPAPAVGDVLWTGFRVYGSLARADVVAVYETADEWAVLAHVGTPLKGPFAAIDNIAFYVGVWRSADRMNETPDEGPAAQERQRAGWKGSDQ